MWAIRSFETLPSTQIHLVEAIRNGTITEPVVIVAEEQTDGVGSRHNHWAGGRGNLFASIAVETRSLPDDLPLQSTSIYFALIAQEALRELGAQVWLKWPNDLYENDAKIGGVMTQKLKNFFVVGLGINLKKNQNSYRALSTDISALILLNIFLKRLDQYPKWKDLFSIYRVEFEQHRAFSVHRKDSTISLQNAVLCDDGSLTIHDERMYSLR